MPFDQAHKQYETARHLPPPLYVLFVQASAYGQACGEHRGAVPRHRPDFTPACSSHHFWGVFPHCLLCCGILLSTEQQGGPTAQ